MNFRWEKLELFKIPFLNRKFSKNKRTEQAGDWRLSTTHPKKILQDKNI
jgi:hypothetical protein